MKYYISGPMTGMENFNFPAFQAASDFLASQGYEVASPHTLSQQGSHATDCDSATGKEAAECTCGVGDVKPWKFYMTKALILQLDCDAWVGLPGWTKSKGAKREFDIAVDLEHKLYLLRSTDGLPLPLQMLKDPYILERIG